MKLDDFLSRPKLLKDDKWVTRWPYVLDASEGSGFNPFRASGCLHYIALGGFWFLFLAFITLPFTVGIPFLVGVWEWFSATFAGADPIAMVFGFLLLGLGVCVTLLVLLAIGDVFDGTPRKTPKRIHPAYTRIGRRRRDIPQDKP